jgi:hypothetical protein
MAESLMEDDLPPVSPRKGPASETEGLAEVAVTESGH